LNNHLPRAFFVTEVLTIEDEYERIRAINKSEFNPENTAILERELTEDIAAPDSCWTEVIHHDPNRLDLKVFTDKQALLVLSEVYYPPGWVIQIDGKEVTQIYKTDHAIQSIVVPAGEHSVKLEFQPDSYYTNIRLATASVAILYIVILVSFFQLSYQKRKQA